MVSSTVSDRQLTIGVEGRFDFRVYDSFRNAYADVGDSVEKYVIDLAAAEYMDSSALGMLLLLREFAGGDDATDSSDGEESAEDDAADGEASEGESGEEGADDLVVSPLSLALSNPYRAHLPLYFEPGARGWAEVAIYNVQGQKLSTLFSGAAEPGKQEFTWDARTDYGEQVASGIYFIRANVGAEEVRRSFVLRR